MAKTRKAIPKNIADEVMFKADLLCCVCEKRGHHIHHIDENPSNNKIDNLVLLCFKHHNEVSRQSGLARQLTPGLLQRYRDSLYRKVEAKRDLPRIEERRPGNLAINDDLLFQLMLDAVSIREIQRIRRQLNRFDGEEALGNVYELAAYIEGSGERARRAILEALDYAASRTRLRMPADMAQAIAHVTYDALPIRNLRSPSDVTISVTEIELMEYGLAIGVALSYDGALYLHDMKIVDAGGELLWKILRYARINKETALQKHALEGFETAEDGAKRSGDPDTVALLKLYREHGLSGDWRNPIYGEKLLERIS